MATHPHPWDAVSLLSLDGGGVRGYWSLLALGRLMEHVAEIEIRDIRRTSQGDPEDEFEGLHSFWPEEFPDNLNRRSAEEKEAYKRDRTHSGRIKALDVEKRFLPCHYFDYICGTSTGALIAIMLGRFRMTVWDCREEYKILAGRVFGNPRLISIAEIGFGMHKFSAKKLQQVFEEATFYHSEDRERQVPTDGPITFATAPGLCKVLVTAGTSREKDGSSADSCLIRSYRHRPERAMQRELAMLRRRTQSSLNALPRRGTAITTVTPSTPNERKLLNYGEASTLEIWQVARAATAAPAYFKPLKAYVHPKNVTSPDHSYFIDGGFSKHNNPTRVAIDEIDKLHGNKALDLIVSVGTARKDGKGKSWIPGVRTLKDGTTILTDPESVHEGVSNLAGNSREWEYFRLNAPQTLDIELGEWKGRKTIEKIENAFNSWAGTNRNDLTTCAEELVRRRRQRLQERDRWERFAIGSHFYCPQMNCESDFDRRDDFISHMQGHEGFDSESDVTKQLISKNMSQWQYREGRKDHP